MSKNGTKADIREVYDLVQTVRKELNLRMDILENNHLQHLSDRISNLEYRVWAGIGALTAITFLLQFFK